MDDDVARLLVQVSATTELLRSNLNKAEAAVAAFERSTNKKVDRVDRNFAGMGKSLAGLKSQLAGVAGGFSLVLASKQMVEFADASSKIQAQLKLATRESGSFAKAQEDVRRIAAGTRSDLGAVASLYAVMTRNSSSLGATQEQVSRATDTVTKAFKVSGASAEEASAATRQLSQALASGTLRGDEFNSIMENGPRLAKLLADSLGVPIGKLREMSQEGQLTSAKLFAALNDKKFTAGLDAEFKEVPATFGDAMTAVRNAATETFGAFERGGKFSQAIYNFAQDGSSNLESLTASAEENGRQIRSIYEGLSSAWAPFKNAGLAALDAIGAKASSVGDFVRKAISFNLRNTQRILNEASSQFLPGNVQPFTFADDFDKKSNASLQGSRRRLDGGHFSRRVSDGSQSRPSAALGSSGGGGGGGGRSRSLARDLKDADPLARQLADTMAEISRDAVDVGQSIREDWASGGNDFKDVIEQVNARMDEERELRLDAIREAADLEEQQFRDLAGLYEELFTGGTKGFLRVLKYEGIRAISEMLARLSQGQSLFGRSGGGGGLFGSLFSSIGSLFGGGNSLGGFDEVLGTASSIFGRAAGGPVTAGTPYIVGEKRPELFVPRVSGTIVPSLKGMGGQAINLTVNAPGATAETVMLIRRELANAAPTIAAAASNMTMRNISRPRL